MLVITLLTFLGGAFYSINMPPPAWRTASLFNPIVLPDQRLPLELLQDVGRGR